LLATLLLAAPLAAFPPAPYYTLYGNVRDQVGAILHADGAEIVLLRDGVEIGRSPVSDASVGDFNYELHIRIDASLNGTPIYSNKAVPAKGVYSVVVDLNGQIFYPIEAAGTLRTGSGGERVRLDLTLGADTNLDGLPDAWQEWVLYQAGKAPGGSGWNINLVTRDGDYDGDGMSNYIEYVAGTFAGDATERFELKIINVTAETVTFEFFAITDKTYAIEKSTDLRNWAAMPFTTIVGATGTLNFRATQVGVLPAYAPANSGAAPCFYRLSVR
jgi:hypothetical protein